MDARIRRVDKKPLLQVRKAASRAHNKLERGASQIPKSNFNNHTTSSERLNADAERTSNWVQRKPEVRGVARVCRRQSVFGAWLFRRAALLLLLVTATVPQQTRQQQSQQQRVLTVKVGKC